jgi:RNA polymerase sigma-70 factor (ECF subfamily)
MRTKARQNEAALVCAARQGDKEALQLLLRRNWAWLKGLAYSVVGDADDVDDVLQDICVRVISKIDTLREPERFRPWLAILARRQALRHRQQKAKRSALLDVALADQHSDKTAQRLLENIEQKEQYERILQALNSLPEKYREVFILEYVHDLTYGQIAEILDIPFTTVQIRLVRARRMILDKVSGNRNRVRKR